MLILSIKIMGGRLVARVASYSYKFNKFSSAQVSSTVHVDITSCGDTCMNIIDQGHA